jgi:hypothetical protein
MAYSGRKAFDGFVGSGSGDISRILGPAGGMMAFDGFVGAPPVYMPKILGASRAGKILLMVLSVRYRCIAGNSPTHTHTAFKEKCKIDYSLYSTRRVYGVSVDALNFPEIYPPLTDKTYKSPPAFPARIVKFSRNTRKGNRQNLQKYPAGLQTCKSNRSIEES